MRLGVCIGSVPVVRDGTVGQAPGILWGEASLHWGVEVVESPDATGVQEEPRQDEEGVPISQPPPLQMFPSPDIPITRHLQLLASPPPSFSVSRCLQLPVFPFPDVPLSRYPHLQAYTSPAVPIPASPSPDVPTSRCPQFWCCDPQPSSPLSLLHFSLLTSGPGDTR